MAQSKKSPSKPKATLRMTAKPAQPKKTKGSKYA